MTLFQSCNRHFIHSIQCRIQHKATAAMCERNCPAICCHGLQVCSIRPFAFIGYTDSLFVQVERGGRHSFSWTWTADRESSRGLPIDDSRTDALRPPSSFQWATRAEFVSGGPCRPSWQAGSFFLVTRDKHKFPNRKAVRQSPLVPFLFLESRLFPTDETSSVPDGRISTNLQPNRTESAGYPRPKIIKQNANNPRFRRSLPFHSAENV